MGSRTAQTVGAVLLVVLVAIAPMATSAASAGATEVALDPGSTSIGDGQTTTFDVVVTNASGGVGAANLTVSLGSNIADITTVSFAHAAQGVDVTYAQNNTTATITGYGMDTNDTGSVVVATVTVLGNATSTSQTTVSVSTNALGNESGDDYTVATEQSATLEVNVSSDGGGGGGGGDDGGSGDDDTASTTVTNLTLGSEEIEAGQSVEVTATILNDGNVTTNRTVNLTSDGTVLATKEVTNLDPGNETTVVFLPTFEQAGTYNLSVGSQTVSLSVVEPTTTSEPITTSTSTPEETDTQAPGFGVSAALVALVALVGFARIRSHE